MSLSRPQPKLFLSTAILVAFTSWHVWKERGRRVTKKHSEKLERQSKIAVELTQGVLGKVLDLRDESSFAAVRIRGSHNIPGDSLWKENRWHELPEQHEPLLVLLSPSNTESHAGLAKEFCDRRASGATTFLIANVDLMSAARARGLLEEGPPKQGGEKGKTSTLFTPSPFLTRAAVALEPQLRHSWLPLTCIDIGCGAGRDAVWLAMRGWNVTAVDCWGQKLQQTAQLASRMGVGGSVQARKGKVKHTGELYLSADPPVSVPASSERENGNTEKHGVSSSLPQGVCGDVGEERVIGPSTPDSDCDVYGLVVAIRFLERSAFDTLARLVDPRGGYILLSTFIEEGDGDGEGRAGFTAQGDVLESSSGSGKTTASELIFGVGETTNHHTVDGLDAIEKGSVLGNGLGNSTSEWAGKGGDAKKSSGRKTNSWKKKKGAVAAAVEAAKNAAIMARWPHETPKDAKKILRRGELARHFGGRHGFEVLEDSVERLPDGRPVSCFLARKLPLLVSSPSSTESSICSSPRGRHRYGTSSSRSNQREGQIALPAFILPAATPVRHADYSSPAKSFSGFMQACRASTDEVVTPLGKGVAGDSDDSGSGSGSSGAARSDHADLWAGVSLVGNKSVRDFTADRAASRQKNDAIWSGSSEDDMK